MSGLSPHGVPDTDKWLRGMFGALLLGVFALGLAIGVLVTA